MKPKLRIQRVKNIYQIDDSLTQHLNDYWHLASATWLHSQHWWWLVYDVKKGKSAWYGYAGMRVHDQETTYTGPTWVSEEVRGLGLQCRLLSIREKFAKKIGINCLISSTDIDNIYSGNNLIKCGFKLTEPWDESLPKEALYWIKHLR